MSFEKVIDYLDKIEAVTNYEQVTKQNSNLRKWYNAHKKRIQNLENEVKRQNDIRIKYKDDAYDLDEFQTLVESSAEKWKKNLLATLLEEKWETEKDSLVEETIQHYMLNYPDNCPANIYNQIYATAVEESEKLLRNKNLWPLWLKRDIEKETERRTLSRMDEEFDKRVEQTAQSRLWVLATERWPVFVRERTTPFFQQSFKDQFMALSQNIEFKCNKCGEECIADLGPEDMRLLVINGNFRVGCCNENCRGFFGRTKITLTFDEVIRKKLLTVPVKKGRYIVVSKPKTSEEEDEKNSESQ